MGRISKVIACIGLGAVLNSCQSVDYSEPERESDIKSVERIEAGKIYSIMQLNPKEKVRYETEAIDIPFMIESSDLERAVELGEKFISNYVHLTSIDYSDEIKIDMVGKGVILDKEGLVLTAHHVVKDAIENQSGRVYALGIDRDGVQRVRILETRAYSEKKDLAIGKILDSGDFFRDAEKMIIRERPLKYFEEIYNYQRHYDVNFEEKSEFRRMEFGFELDGSARLLTHKVGDVRNIIVAARAGSFNHSEYTDLEMRRILSNNPEKIMNEEIEQIFENRIVIIDPNLSPGLSGSPVFDKNGKLTGIISELINREKESTGLAAIIDPESISEFLRDYERIDSFKSD